MEELPPEPILIKCAPGENEEKLNLVSFFAKIKIINVLMVIKLQLKNV
jgi:hypothetical protein